MSGEKNKKKILYSLNASRTPWLELVTNLIDADIETIESELSYQLKNSILSKTNTVENAKRNQNGDKIYAI